MELPIGSIVIYGSDNFPIGWQLCDGTNGTPDLRNRFIRGAENAGALLATGGSTTHKHANSATATKSTHKHSFSGSTNTPNKAVVTAIGDNNNPTAGAHGHTVSGDTGEGGDHSHTIPDTDYRAHLPPHIKLYYIMRVD